MPNACRIIERTTMIRTNDVVQMSIAGMKAIIVRMSASRTVWVVPAPSAAGAGIVAQAAVAPVKRKTAAIKRIYAAPRVTWGPASARTAAALR